MTSEEFAELHSLALKVSSGVELTDEEEVSWDALFAKASEAVELAGVSEGLVQ